MKPMLARTAKPSFSHLPCYVQPKLNGVRALYQAGMFQSRDEKVWKDTVVKHVVDELLSFTELGNLVLDGEFYCHGMRLQEINGAIAVNRAAPNGLTEKICYHVFDVVNPFKKFSDRWFELYHGLIAAELPHVKAVPTAHATSWIQVEQHFHIYIQAGYEGIMLRPDGPYEYGEHTGRNGNQTTFRSRNLWKYKHWEDDEFECVGITQGMGKADIGIGALVLRCKDSDATFGVGTGFTDADRVQFAMHPPIGQLVKVRYLTLTAEGKPFNPSFLAVLGQK
jgi:ATP-dependent DNA ligase